MLNLEIVSVRRIKPDAAHFDGTHYDIAQDHERLSRQMESVKEFMQDYHWHSVQEISQAVHAPENSVSAQMRNLRKLRHGAHLIKTVRASADGLFLYRMQRPQEPLNMTTALWNLAKKYGIECHRHENELVMG